MWQSEKEEESGADRAPLPLEAGGVGAAARQGQGRLPPYCRDQEGEELPKLRARRLHPPESGGETLDPRLGAEREEEICRDRVRVLR